MSFWQDRAVPFIEHARTALVRTPVEAALGVVMASALSYGIHESSSAAGRLVITVMLCCYLALVASFGVSALHAFRAVDSRIRWILNAAFLAAIGLYGALALDIDLATELWRYGALALAATMGFGVLPAAISWRARDEREAFWHFNARALGQLTSVGSYLMLLYIGLAIALAAVNNLFDLSLDGDLWGYMFAWIPLALAPWLTAAGLPALVSDDATMTSQARAGLSLLATYLILPLVSLYMLILYAYQLKVVASGFELPKNVMSFLTLGAAILLLISMFLADQLRRTEEGQGIFIRAAELLPAAFIPLLPMGLWAVLVRVQQHGWTEFRYARVLSLICLIIIFSISAWRLLRRQKQPLAATFATFGVAGVIAAVGPLSMTEVARRSQLARLDVVLTENDLLTPEHKLRALTAPFTVKGDQSPQEVLDYLIETHGHESVKHLYPAAVLAKLDEDTPSYGSRRNRNSSLAPNVLGWQTHLHQPHAVTSIYINSQYDAPTPIPEGARTLFQVNAYRRTDHSAVAANATLPELRLDAASVIVHYKGKRAVADLNPLLQSHWRSVNSNAPHDSQTFTDAERLLPLQTADGAPMGWLLLKSAQLQARPDKSDDALGEVTNVDALLFLR
jgi:hypothetical protein